MTTEPWLVLVGGLSRAGKSTLADAICAVSARAEHLPLDKYFHEVPAGQTFLAWVQNPASIDWQLVAAHLERLRAGLDTYTPSLDWRGAGKRLSQGGDEAHPRARLVRGGATCYVLPGCHALAAAWTGPRVRRIFIETPLATIASRCEGAAVDPGDVEATLQRHLTPTFRSVLAYAARADAVVHGDALAGDGLRAYATALCTELQLAHS